METRTESLAKITEWLKTCARVEFQWPHSDHSVSVKWIAPEVLASLLEAQAKADGVAAAAPDMHEALMKAREVLEQLDGLGMGLFDGTQTTIADVIDAALSKAGSQ